MSVAVYSYIVLRCLTLINAQVCGLLWPVTQCLISLQPWHYTSTPQSNFLIPLALTHHQAVTCTLKSHLGQTQPVTRPDLSRANLDFLRMEHDKLRAEKVRRRWTRGRMGGLFDMTS